LGQDAGSCGHGDKFYFSMKEGQWHILVTGKIISSVMSGSAQELVYTRDSSLDVLIARLKGIYKVSRSCPLSFNV
jgi:hypothetical protein